MLKTTFIANVIFHKVDWYFVVANAGDCYRVYLDHDHPTNKLNITRGHQIPQVSTFIRLENKKHTRAMMAEAIKALMK